MIDFLVKNKNHLILIFTFAYLVSFTVNAVVWTNFEFLYYTVLMVALIFLVVVLNKALHLGFFILFNLSILGFLHLLGGNLYLGGVRLYDFYLISGFIRYDNFVHTYATFITTLALPDIKKAKSILGWYPLITLDDGLEKTLEYTRANKQLLSGYIVE